MSEYDNLPASLNVVLNAPNAAAPNGGVIEAGLGIAVALDGNNIKVTNTAPASSDPTQRLGLNVNSPGASTTDVVVGGAYVQIFDLGASTGAVNAHITGINGKPYLFKNRGPQNLVIVDDSGAHFRMGSGAGAFVNTLTIVSGQSVEIQYPGSAWEVLS